jgi:hypothetical protein
MLAYYGHEQALAQQRQQQQQQQQQLLQQQQTPVLPPLPHMLPNHDVPDEEIRLNDIKRMKSTQMNRKITNSHRVGKRSTLMETPSPTTAFVSNKSDETNSLTSNSRPQSIASSSQLKRGSQNELEGDLSQLNINRPTHKYTKSVPKARSFYFAELGALQHFMLKHIAVLYLEEILHDHFTLEELADLIDDRKNSTLWGKFVTSLRAGGNKKVPRAKGKREL